MNSDYIIDTSSLVALARYYSPFDKSGIVFSLAKTRFHSQQWLLSSQVLKESERVAKGIVVNTFGFLKSVPVMKLGSPVSAEQHEQVDSWVNKNFRRSISDSDYRVVKGSFMASADCEIIMLAEKNGLCVVTEESRQQNYPPSVASGGSLPSPKVVFKKIPLICDQISIGCINVAELLEKSDPNLIFSN